MYIRSQWARKTLAEWELANTSFAQEQKRLVKSILKDNQKSTHVKINLMKSIKEQLKIKLATIQSEKPYVRQKYCQNAIRFQKLGKGTMIICSKGFVAMNDKHSKLLNEYVILMDKKKKILDRKKTQLKHRNSLIASISPYTHNPTENLCISGAKMTSSITICPKFQVAPQMKISKNMNRSLHVSKKSELSKSIVLYQSQVCQEYETLIPKARKIWSNQQQMIDWMKFSMSSQAEFNLWLSIVGISKYQRKFSKLMSMHRQNQDSTLNYSMSRSEDLIMLEMSRDQSRKAEDFKKLNRPLFKNLIQEKGAQIQFQEESIRIIDFIDINSETLLNVSKSLTNKSVENNSISEQKFGQERMTFEEKRSFKMENKVELDREQNRITSKKQDIQSIEYKSDSKYVDHSARRFQNIEIQIKQSKASTEIFLPQPKNTEEEQLLIEIDSYELKNFDTEHYATSKSIQIQNLPYQGSSRSRVVERLPQKQPQTKPLLKKMSSFMCQDAIIQEEEEDLCQKKQQKVIYQNDDLEECEKNIVKNNRALQEAHIPKIDVKENRSDEVNIVQTQMKPQMMISSSLNSTKSSKQKLNKILQNLNNLQKHASNPDSTWRNPFQPLQKVHDNNIQSLVILDSQLNKIGQQDSLQKMNFTTKLKELNNQGVSNQSNYQNKQNISAKMNLNEQRTDKVENPNSMNKLNPFSSEKSNSKQSKNPFNYNPFSKNVFSQNNRQNIIQKITENQYNPFAANKRTENQYDPFASKTKILNQNNISNQIVANTTKHFQNSPKNFNSNAQNKNSSTQFKKAFGRGGNQDNQVSSKIDLHSEEGRSNFCPLTINQNHQNQTLQKVDSKKAFSNHPFQSSSSSSSIQTESSFKNPFLTQTQNQFKSGKSANIFTSNNLFKSDQTDGVSLNMFGESKKRH